MRYSFWVFSPLRQSTKKLIFLIPYTPVKFVCSNFFIIIHRRWNKEPGNPGSLLRYKRGLFLKFFPQSDHPHDSRTKQNHGGGFGPWVPPAYWIVISSSPASNVF